MRSIAKVQSVCAIAVAVPIIFSLFSRHVRWSVGYPQVVNAEARDSAKTQNPKASTDAQNQSWSILHDFASYADSGAFGSKMGPTWKSDCDLFLPTCPGGGSSPDVSALPSQTNHIKLKSQVGLAAGASLGGESIFYNPKAQEALGSCGSNPTKGCISGITFQDGSMIGRFAWQRVTGNTCQSFMVFQPSTDATSYIPSKAITIDTSTCKMPTGTTQTVPLSHFFSVPISAENQNHTVFLTPAGPVLGNGDIAVVLGFHLIEKVMGQWVWSTFWWSSEIGAHGDPEITGYTCAPPSACPTGKNPEKWANYVMNTVPSSAAPGQSFVPIANPYVDVPAARNTNCVVCHSFAMIPRNKNAGQSPGRSCGAQTATSVTQQTLTSATQSYANSCSPARTPVDSIWSVAMGNQVQCDQFNCTAASK